MPGVTFGSGFVISVNTGTAAVDTAVTPPSTGTPVTIDVPAGPYVSIAGTGTTLTVLSQTLSGSFSVQVATLAGGGTQVAIAATDVSLSLGTSGNGISLLNGQGALLVTASGVAGELSGQIALQVGGQTPISGAFELAINGSTSAVDQSFTVAGQTVALSLPGGPYVEFQATDATISVAGQTLTGNLAVIAATSAAGDSIVEVGISDGSLELGAGTGGAPLLAVTEAAGALFIEPSGMAGSLTGKVALNVPDVKLIGTLAIQVNTGAAPVADSIAVGQTTVDVNVPGGPYLQIAGTGVQLNVLGQTLGGDVTVTEQTGQPLTIAVANLTAAFGPAGAPVLTVTQAPGPAQFQLGPDGIAGSIAVNLTLGNVPG
ncbi:MAG: hypothetical protein ACRDL8_14210, partial [Solirubrobacteraceae bacterium]